METPIEPTATTQETAQESSLNKLAEFIGDVLEQLSSLQSLMAQRINEIEELERRAAAAEERLSEIEPFLKALKLRLRQQREGTI